MQEEGAVGLAECAFGAADDEGAELERGVDVFEEDLPVLEVVDAGDAAGGGDGLEEAGGGAVGVDAGGDEEADEAVGFDEAEGAFDEQRIEVDVAATQQGVVTGGADDLAEAVGAGLGCVKGLGQWIALLAQAPDALAAGGGGGGAGQFGIAGGEPFDFLELDAVPGGDCR